MPKYYKEWLKRETVFTLIAVLVFLGGNYAGTSFGVPVVKAAATMSPAVWWLLMTMRTTLDLILYPSEES